MHTLCDKGDKPTKEKPAHTRVWLFKSELANPTQRSLPAAATATATSTTIPAATAAPPTTTARAFALGASLVHVERASSHLRSVQSSNGLFTVLGIGHLDETKPARTPGVPVGHDGHSVHLPVLFKQLAKFVFSSVEIQIPNEDVLQAIASRVELFECSCLRRERGISAWRLVVGPANSSNAGGSIAGLAHVKSPPSDGKK
jgi:hypothetical protein